MHENNKTIWLATSDAAVGKILQDRIKRQNFSLSRFDSGVKAAVELKKRQPDFFILDFQLNSIDGAKFCEYIKRDERYRRISLILLLSEDAPSDFESSADVVLHKMDLENLPLKVLAALSAIIHDEKFPAQLWENADKRTRQTLSGRVEFFDLKNKFDSVFEKNVAGAAEIDDKDRIISVNPVMESILKMPVLDIIGENIYKRFPSLKVSMKNRKAAGEAVILEYEGRYFEAMLTSDMHKETKGGYFLMLFDITERQAYQEKQKSYAEELEKEVEKRLLQVKTANSELERLSRLKSEFLSNVSHEMRTPLATIKGFTETLQKRDVDAENRSEFLNIIATETARLEKIVNNILDITQIQQGLMKKHLVKSVFDLRDELDYVIKLTTPMAQKKCIKLLFKRASSPLKISADRDRIRQVLINIIENAVKFSSSETEVILRLSGDKGYAVFECEDKGPGIPEDEKGKIFEKFYMVDGSDRRTEKGTGIGLFIADSIAKLHNGKIDVMPGKRKGSVFILRLPLNLHRNGEA